jgi:hypothetical protein
VWVQVSQPLFPGFRERHGGCNAVRMSDDLESCDLQLRALMAGVRTAADRMKSRLPADVDVNDVVSAGYLALTQALAYWQDGSDEAFEVHATRRASAAMLAVLRGSNPPSHDRQRFVNEMDRVQHSLFDALLPELPEIEPGGGLSGFETLVSPPLESEKPPRHSDVERRDQDIAMDEIGVHVA